MAEQEVLALWSQYGDLYNEIVQPERKYAISHYLRTQWAPLLGAARLWFVVALRQRCFWNHKQDWCVVDKKTLARESGLSLRTVNRIIAAVDRPETDDSRDGWAGWFFGKTRRRRYHQDIGRTVNAPNRYHVLLDDPLTPAHQAVLARYLETQTAEGTPEDTLRVLQALCDRPDLLYEILSPAPWVPDTPVPCLAAGFALDVVRAACPLPAQESALYPAIVQAASRLHNAITRPERVYVGNQYFRLRWLPALGPVLSALVVNLRARCYWNQRTGELRDTCQATWSELAQETGCTARQLRNLRQKPGLAHFVDTLSEGHGCARSTFRVRLYDPLTEPDQARFAELAQASPGVQVNPETGQLDMYPLLTQAGKAAPLVAPQKSPETTSREHAAQPLPRETLPQQGKRSSGWGRDDPSAKSQETRGDSKQAEHLAPGSAPQAEKMAPGNTEGTAPAEILAPSEWNIWHLEGLQAEVLAPQSGNSGTTVQVQIITPTQKGLTETALPAKTALSPIPGSAQSEMLLAAVRTHLLTQLGIQEPNRSKVAKQQPRCDWIVAWGLYVLTQPGLSRNKAGYVYNRLWEGDPPPPELLELAGLSPSVYRLFCRAEKRGNEWLIPDALYEAFVLWRRLLAPLRDWQASLPGLAADPEWEPPDKIALPDAIEGMLLGHEEVGRTDAGLTIETRDLAHAIRLARAVCDGGWGQSIEVFFAGGQRYALNAEVLALTVEPLSKETWDAARQELRWQMSRAVYDRWWREVQPLGVETEPASASCVVLGAPSAEVRAWILSKQMPMVARTLAGVLGQEVNVRLDVYARALPEASLEEH